MKSKNQELCPKISLQLVKALRSLVQVAGKQKESFVLIIFSNTGLFEGSASIPQTQIAAELVSRSESSQGTLTPPASAVTFARRQFRVRRLLGHP